MSTDTQGHEAVHHHQLDLCYSVTGKHQLEKSKEKKGGEKEEKMREKTAQ